MTSIPIPILEKLQNVADESFGNFSIEGIVNDLFRYIEKQIKGTINEREKRNLEYFKLTEAEIQQLVEMYNARPSKD